MKIHLTTKKAQIFTVLLLTGILSVGNGLTLLKSATATPTDLLPANKNEVLERNLAKNRLPQPVADAVLQAVSRRERISTPQLEITDFSQQTWRNGCLDLPKPNEFCTQALVSGWRVVVSDGSQKWIYHSDRNGRALRLVNSDTPTSKSLKNLPESLKDAVLQAASQRLNLPTNQLTIIKDIQRTWRDGCLELSKPDEVCTQTLVNGWLVEVVAVDQTLVYHTNDSGSAIRLNEKASEISETDRNTIKPVPIPTTELPLPIDSGVIFQQISSGGFAGRTEKTVLMDDGRLIRVGLGDRRISHKQLRQFQQLLEKEKFTEFKNLSYPAPPGAADSITYTLTSRDGTVEYNDSSQSSLPENLQVIVRAWNGISIHVGAGEPRP